MLSLGWPITITIAFEAMLFNACVFLMGRIGIDEMAAYQIALNVAALAFMAPLGLSMAGGVRVGIDGRCPQSARREACSGAGHRVLRRRNPDVCGTNVAGCRSTLLACICRLRMPPIRAVLALVASFLPIAAAFALFDATQVAAAQALRGLKDVRLPMIITGIAYWIIGFPVAAWLGLYTDTGAPGVWYGLLSGLVAASVLLVWRLWVLTVGDLS